MPLVSINILNKASAESVQAISTVIYHAMVTVANVPAHDKFQIITRHESDELVFPYE